MDVLRRVALRKFARREQEIAAERRAIYTRPTIIIVKCPEGFIDVV